MFKRGSMVLAVAWALVGGIAEAQQLASAHQPTTEHKKLAVFVGTWKDEAEMKPSPLGAGGKISLTETCDWLTGGFSIVCNAETTGSMGDLKTLSILGYDPEEKVYRLYEFNSLGWSSTAKGTVDGDTWTFDGESKMGGKTIKSRFTIKLPSPDSATMRSEVSVEGGPMTLLMELKGSRVKQGPCANSCTPHASEGWPFEFAECYRALLSSHGAK